MSKTPKGGVVIGKKADPASRNPTSRYTTRHYCRGD